MVPQFGLTEGRFALVFAALFSGGFLYLVWFDEFFRIWSRKQKKRIAKTVALRGLQVGFIGALFLGFDVSYAVIFHSVYSYQHLVRSVGGILFSVAMLATSSGLLLDWRDLPAEVDLAAHRALLRMREAGFQLDDSQLWIGIDPKVPSTGFSYPAGNESVILVKPWTVYAPDGGLLLTLAHEICHIYLFHTKHPSHISGVVEEAYDPVVKRFSKKWQRRVLRTAIDYPGEGVYRRSGPQNLRRSKRRMGERDPGVVWKQSCHPTGVCVSRETQNVARCSTCPSQLVLRSRDGQATIAGPNGNHTESKRQAPLDPISNSFRGIPVFL